MGLYDIPVVTPKAVGLLSRVPVATASGRVRHAYTVRHEKEATSWVPSSNPEPRPRRLVADAKVMTLCTGTVCRPGGHVVGPGC